MGYDVKKHNVKGNEIYSVTKHIDWISSVFNMYSKQVYDLPFDVSDLPSSQHNIVMYKNNGKIERHTMYVFDEVWTENDCIIKKSYGVII